MNAPKNGATPGVEGTGGGAQIELDGGITDNDTALVKHTPLLDTSSICVFSCSFSGDLGVYRCPFRCAPLSVRDAEVQP